MSQVCEVRSYFPKSNDNDRTRKNDAKALS